MTIADGSLRRQSSRTDGGDTLCVVGVRLLGPVDVVVDGVPRRIAGLRPKAVLAVLGLAAGGVVDSDRLIDVVWDGRPPATALNTLRRHVSYLTRCWPTPAHVRS